MHQPLNFVYNFRIYICNNYEPHVASLVLEKITSVVLSFFYSPFFLILVQIDGLAFYTQNATTSAEFA